MTDKPLSIRERQQQAFILLSNLVANTAGSREDMGLSLGLGKSFFKHLLTEGRTEKLLELTPAICDRMVSHLQWPTAKVAKLAELIEPLQSEQQTQRNSLMMQSRSVADFLKIAVADSSVKSITALCEELVSRNENRGHHAMVKASYTSLLGQYAAFLKTGKPSANVYTETMKDDIIDILGMEGNLREKFSTLYDALSQQAAGFSKTK